MSASRLLVIDESLPDRLSTELTRRGRPAKRLSELNLKGAPDPELLTRLAGESFEWVLVTADDRMPLDWGDLLASLRSTVATVDGRRAAGWTADQVKRETVHRWAHQMALQETATVRRYSLRSHRLWRPRRRR